MPEQPVRGEPSWSALCLVLALLLAGLLVAYSKDRGLDRRIDRLEHGQLVCHPIAGPPAGDRLCKPVTP